MFTQSSRIAFTVLLAWELTGISTSVAKKPPKPSTPIKNPEIASPKKPERWHFGDDRLRNDTISWRQKKVRATDIDPNAVKPLRSVSHITIQGRPLLWMNDEREVLGDKKYLSDLKVVRYQYTNGLERGDRGIVIGSYTGGDALSPVQIVELLIRSQIVRCKSMSRASVGIDLERTEKDGYHAQLSGTDLYATSKINVVRFTFGIRIDKDGTIRLTKD